MEIYNITNIRIQNTIKDFILDDKLKSRFYGYFCQYIDFRYSKNVDKYKPFVDISGMAVSYNDIFIDSLTDEELRFMLIFICFLPYFGDKK
jgi:hypothetical protein